MGGYKPTEAQTALRKLIRDKKSVLAYGGSRSGKTFEFCRALAVLALRYGGRYGVFRRYFNAVKNSVFNDTFPKVMSLCFPGVSYSRNLADCSFKLSNNAEIWFLGLDDKERTDKILGREFAALYFNECSEIAFESVEVALTRLSQRVFDENGKQLRNRFFCDCNPPGKSHWSYRMFFERVHPISRSPLIAPESYAAIQINPQANAANLPEGYIEETLASGSERSRRRFLLGEYSDENENALWRASTMIDPFRVSQAPGDLERIVVGVDPAVTSSDSSDHTGIVVIGKRYETDGREHFYVLEDRSLIASPQEWARETVAAYRRWNADLVVAEVNQGGDLVAATLRAVDNNIPVRNVRATRGKVLRAEPISVLYSQGVFHHVGEFEELEREMTSFVGSVGDDSPDRMDALVWAATELIEGAEVHGGAFRFG